MKNDLKEFAKSIDIEYIGFGNTEFDKEFIERLIARREGGHLSGFEEEDENKRVDIEALLKGTRTIISIAVPYRTIEVNNKKPYFSKASLGLDYHIIVKKKLEILANFIYNKYGARCEYFCDIGPLSDREIAYKCGIGFYGKNNNIITEKYGSFVFLGEILTELYIEPDEKLENRCGECDLCIKACPVGAIESPHYINAKRCLSYVSQKKEELSEEELEKLGTRIYGCDTCQDVCPHNRGEALSPITEFEPENWNYNIDIEYILNISSKAFKNTFGKISGGWRGKNLLKRNLVIAMGNSGDKGYIPLLHRIKDEKIRHYAEKSIKKLECGVGEGEGKNEKE